MSHQTSTGTMPLWQAFAGSEAPQGVTPRTDRTVTPAKENKRLDFERARKLVVRLLLSSHYSFAAYSTTRGAMLAWSVASGLDAFGMMFGILMADVVLIASMEGIRHGVFVSWQKKLAWLAYACAATGIGLATFAHGSNTDFQNWYVHQLLPFEAVLMSFFSFILLTTFLDVLISNRKRAADLELSWANVEAEILAEEVKLQRFHVDLAEAKRRNGYYKKALKQSGVGGKVQRQLVQAADDSGNVIMALLGLSAEVQSSGDGQSKGASVAPSAKKWWSRLRRN